MLVQVLHEDRETRSFEHVANVEAPEHYDVERALEYAFRRTQNIEGSWSMGPSIDVNGEMVKNQDYSAFIDVIKPLRTWSDGIVMGHRSSMMYDRMIVDGEIYEVDGFGFRKLEIA